MYLPRCVGVPREWTVNQQRKCEPGVLDRVQIFPSCWLSVDIGRPKVELKFSVCRRGGCFSLVNEVFSSAAAALLPSDAQLFHQPAAKRQTNEKKYYLVELIYMHLCLWMKRYASGLVHTWEAKLFTNAVNFVTLPSLMGAIERRELGSTGISCWSDELPKSQVSRGNLARVVECIGVRTNMLVCAVIFWKLTCV